jgi:FkbM family methyltransferase
MTTSNTVHLLELRRAIGWRARRARQYMRLRYLSWRHPEVLVDGVRIPLFDYISDNVREAMFDGGYEAAELRTIADQLEADDVVLEIGTGIGLISTYCAKKIGADRVFTFEGNPELEPLIRKVYEVNGVTPTLQIGILGRDEGTATFFVHDDFWSSSTVARRGGGRQVTVPRLDLNAVLARIHPTFLIVDIEGGESELFEFVCLNGIRKISIELHDSVIGTQRVQEICKQLEEEGFAIDWAHSASIDGFKKELFLRRMHPAGAAA